jgi:uncharacterized protein YbjT (DUF2867 family)
MEEWPVILITGASGNNGTEIIKRLSASGIAIRGMVRTRQLREGKTLPNVEFVTGDFDDPETLHRVLEGVDRAFLTTSSSERVETQQLSFVEAARAAGVRHLVYLSQLHAAKNSPVRFLRYHGVVEEAISSSGMAFTHLRPNLYMQGLLGFRSLIASQGRFFAPVSDARVSIVDVRDIAAVAASALTENRHEGKVYEITGPEALTQVEMASQLSEALGKPITFVDVPEAAMRESLKSFGFPDWQADGLIEDYAHYRRGEAAGVSSGVQDLTGVAPRAFKTFAGDYMREFLD